MSIGTKLAMIVGGAIGHRQGLLARGEKPGAAAMWIPVLFVIAVVAIEVGTAHLDENEG